MKFLTSKNSKITRKDSLSRELNSFVYKLNVSDIEQLEIDAQERFYRDISNDLIKIEENKIFKFYFWEGKSLLNTEVDDIKLDGISYENIENPVDELLFKNQFPTGVEYHSDFMKIGHEYWGFLEVEALPNKISANFLSDLQIDYVLQVKRKAKLSSTLLLARKQNSSEKLANTHHKNSIEEKKYFEAEKLREKLDDNRDSLFNYSVIFILKGQSKEHLDYLIDASFDLFKQREIKAFRHCFGLKGIFESLFIGKFNDFNSDLEDSAYISNLLPLKSEFIHEDGVSLSSVSNNELFFDVFDKNAVNPHMFISGATGTGKSSFAGYYVYSHVKKFNSNAIFVDLGGGLSRISSYLDGKNYSSKINIALFKDDISFIRDIIVSIVGVDNLTRIQKGIIFEAIIHFNKTNDQFNFKKLIEFISNKIEGLNYYFNEYYDYFISSTDADLPSICYVDTSNIPDELLSAYLVFIRRLADNLPGKTFIVWDECWKFADKASYALTYAIKTDRKKDISNIFINQEYDSVDINDSELTEIIHSNINFKVIFNQGSINKISNQTDQLLIKNHIFTKKGEYSQALLKAEGLRKIIKVNFDPFFYELTMTEKAEYQKQELFIERHCEFLDFKRSFDKWIDFKYGRGGVCV